MTKVLLSEVASVLLWGTLLSLLKWFPGSCVYILCSCLRMPVAKFISLLQSY